MSTLLPSSQALGDSLIQRVMGLIETPYHLLSEAQAVERLELGARRCKETLSSTPWYAKKAAKAALEGREPEYWEDLWQHHCNMVHPSVKSSTPEAVANMQEPPPTSATPGAGLMPTPAQANSQTGGRLTVARSHPDQRVSEETMQWIRDLRSGKLSTPEYAQ
jgi:hypothetical protein